jgi:hypothetical protein
MLGMTSLEPAAWMTYLLSGDERERLAGQATSPPGCPVARRRPGDLIDFIDARAGR